MRSSRASCATTTRRSRFRVTDLVPSVREALEGEALAAPKCPTCGQPTKRQTALIPQAAGQIRGAQPLPAAWADVCEDPVFSVA